MPFKNIWNNGINFENFESKWFIVFFVPFVFFWFFWNYQKSITIDFEKEFYQRHTEDEFQGIVQRKWLYHHSVYI